MNWINGNHLACGIIEMNRLLDELNGTRENLHLGNYQKEKTKRIFQVGDKIGKFDRGKMLLYREKIKRKEPIHTLFRRLFF
jgi:hypothetical protein